MAHSASKPQRYAPVLVRSKAEQRTQARQDARVLRQQTNVVSRNVESIRESLLMIAGMDGMMEDPGLTELRQMEQVQETQSALATLRSLSETTLAREPELLHEAQAVVRLAEERALTLNGMSANSLMTNTLTKAAPTGSTPIANGGSAGMSWAGIGNRRTDAQGVANAQYLRKLATENPWASACITIRKQQIGRAEIAVTPMDEMKSSDTKVQKSVDGLLSYPNEYRDSYRSFIEPVIDDSLILDRGCFSKDLDAKGIPHHLYAEDGATIKIYADWDGSPKKPRYVYQKPNTIDQVPLFNDQLVCIMANAASYRFGFAPMQILLRTIQGDLAATEKAMNLVRDVPAPHLAAITGLGEQGVRKLAMQYQKDIAGKREVAFIGLTGDQELKLYPMMLSLKEYQFMEWQEYLARKICAVFQISPQTVGITFDINKATGEVQQDITEDNGIINLMLLIEEYLNREVLADWAPLDRDGRPQMDAINLRVWYPEVSEIQRMRHAERVIKTAVAGLAGLPLLTPNMALRMLGEEPMPGGNRLWALTKDGVVPTPLGYDDDFGDYGNLPTDGALGAQDPASGVDEAATDTSAADAKGKKKPTNDPGALGNESSATGQPPDSGVPSGHDDDQAHPNGPSQQPTASKALQALLERTQQYQPQHRQPHSRPDLRTPGKRWNPASDRMAIVARSAATSTVQPQHSLIVKAKGGQAKQAQQPQRDSNGNVKPQSLGRIAPKFAARQQKPAKVQDAAAHLRTQVAHIFERAEKRGLQSAED